MTACCLVKACMTFQLCDGIDWKDTKNRVEGVQFIDDSRATMIFRGPSKDAAAVQTSTTLLGVKQHAGVRVCSLYDSSRTCDDGNLDHGRHEAAIVKSLLEAPGTRKNGVLSFAYDFVVFRANVSAAEDVDRYYQILLRRDASAKLTKEEKEQEEEEPVDGQEYASFVMNTDLDDSLYITHDRVVWNIADDKILVSVEGKNPTEAKKLVDRSRSKIGLF